MCEKMNEFEWMSNRSCCSVIMGLSICRPVRRPKPIPNWPGFTGRFIGLVLQASWEADSEASSEANLEASSEADSWQASSEADLEASSEANSWQFSSEADLEASSKADSLEASSEADSLIEIRVITRAFFHHDRGRIPES